MARGHGHYYVDMIFMYDGRLETIRVTERASKADAFFDAADILKNGYVEGGRKYDVRGIIVDRGCACGFFLNGGTVKRPEPSRQPSSSSPKRDKRLASRPSRRA